jgi:hypothetical protein
VHDLRPFARDVWVADGPPVRLFGAPLPTRMVVVKLADGSLWIDSPVDATEEQARTLERIGPVAHLVSPTQMHDWRLAKWSTWFPQAAVWYAAMLADLPHDVWCDDIDRGTFRGSVMLDETEFYHRASRTLIIADFVQNYSPQPGHLVLNLIKRLGGVLGGGSPVDLRLSFVGRKRRQLGRESVRKLLAWDFDKVIIAHGDLPAGDARHFVERSFRWLY